MKTTFTVLGIPAPKGSTKSFLHRFTGKQVTVPDNPRTKPWQAEVARAAKAAGVPLITGAVAVVAVFVLPRPRGHFGTGKNAAVLRPGAPAHHVVKPDGDKLLRTVFDGLTKGRAWNDDAQVVDVRAVKRYAAVGEPTGVHIEIEAVGEGK